MCETIETETAGEGELLPIEVVYDVVLNNSRNSGMTSQRKSWATWTWRTNKRSLGEGAGWGALEEEPKVIVQELPQRSVCVPDLY